MLQLLYPIGFIVQDLLKLIRAQSQPHDLQLQGVLIVLQRQPLRQLIL